MGYNKKHFQKTGQKVSSKSLSDSQRKAVGLSPLSSSSKSSSSSSTIYAGGKAPDDPSNRYNTATGQLNPNYRESSGGSSLPSTTTIPKLAPILQSTSGPKASVTPQQALSNFQSGAWTAAQYNQYAAQASGQAPTTLQPTTQPVVQPQTQPTQLQPQQPVVNTASPFTSQLDLGARGENVKALQQFLNKAGFPVSATGAGSPGNETDFFGPATQAALQKYQASKGIVSGGSATSTGFGRLGPKTLEAINQDLASGQYQLGETATAPQDMVTEPPLGLDVPPPVMDTETVGEGMSNAELSALMSKNYSLKNLNDIISQSLLPSQNEQNLQQQLADVAAKLGQAGLNLQAGLDKTEAQAIPTPFIVGQQREQARQGELEKGTLLQAQENIQNQLAIATEARKNVLEAAKTMSTLQRQNFADILTVVKGIDPRALPTDVQNQLAQLASQNGIPPALLFAGLDASFKETQADLAYKQAQTADKTAPEKVATPTSYREWELAGKPGTYAQWLAEQSVKAPTQAQQTVATYATRLEQANPIIDDLEDYMVNLNPASFEAQQRLPSYLQSNQYKQFDQASRNFINAVLRRESGAVISPSEFDNAYKQYLPRPKDDAATLTNKRKNRDIVYNSFKKAAGSAYSSVGDLLSTDNNDPLGLR